MEKKHSLADLLPGESAVIQTVLCEEGMKERFWDLGFIPGSRVSCVGRSPAGDPKAYEVRGTVIAIRANDARGILLEEKGGGMHESEG